MKHLIISLFTLFLSIGNLYSQEKSRIIVTTDLGGTDPDDIQSMIHLLVCSDVIDIEGIISQLAWIPAPDNTTAIKDIIDQYGKVLPNLRKHSSDFPSAEYLKSITVQGQKVPHMDGVGNGLDSPGSDLIIKVVDDKQDPRPVWLVAWGGMNTIAQAIWKVKNTRNNREFTTFANRIRIYDILGQDDSGAWIAKNFPEILYIRNKEVYGWAPDDQWIKSNIQKKGPLGSIYPDRRWATEGDSPSFLYLCNNGLNTPEHPEYGGWGGRFSPTKQKNIRGMDFIEKSNKSESVYDDYYMIASSKEGIEAINRWKRHIYNDFAARIAWSVSPEYEMANHHPKPAILNDDSTAPIYIKASAGDTLSLDASGSFDPDGDSLNFNWSFYSEPSTYNGNLEITNANNSDLSLKIPTEAKGKTIHLVLEVTDNGQPNLTSYKRVVVSVK